MNRTANSIVSVLAATSLACGCATGPTPAFEKAEDTRVLLDDEARFWEMSNATDELIGNMGVLVNDPALDAYLQGVLDSLFPEFNGKIHVRAIKDSELNAFAMANGSVYINTGMLARLDNEAELATVLGHEGVHFTERHIVEGTRNQKSNMVLAQLLAMAGGGLVGSVMAATSVSGFSRALESEADLKGFTRMVKAGYDVSHAGDAFARFARELKARDIKGAWFFASHPKMEERALAFTRFAGAAPAGGDVRAEQFLAATASVRMDALQAMTDKADYKTLIHILHTEDRLSNYPPAARFYLGEAYRLRNKQGDAALAEEQYRQMLAADDTFAPAYGALGVLQMKAGDKALALGNLQTYLQLEPNAIDRAYVERYIEQLSGN